MYKNFTEINDVIIEYLKSGNPFSCLRIDNTAGYVFHSKHKKVIPSPEFYNPYTMIEAGVTPNIQYHWDVVVPETMAVMKQCDILGFVDVSTHIKNDAEFLSQFGEKPIFTDFMIMDPGGLLGISPMGELSVPWTQYLKDKKVLVLSSHANSIRQQWEKIDLIWGNNREKIAPFELVDAISSPFHPAIDDRQYPNCNNFMDLINITKERIDQYDYDVLLTGITTQSPFYAQHAKDRGKIGIQTGATIQMFFGVYGKRWTNSQLYSRWHELYNEHWMYPLDIDKPSRKDNVNNLEFAYAYW